MVFSGSTRNIATVLTAEDNATGTLQEVEESGSTAATALGGTARALTGLASGLKAATFAAGTFFAVGNLLVAKYGEAEKTFARVQAVTGATEQTMQRFTDTAMQLGKNLPISIGQAAQALEQLSFAGFSAEEAMTAASGAADLAVASSMGMGQAARTTATLLRQYGLAADETAQVTGTMAAVFRSSMTDMQEMSSALQRVGATARQLGISIQETSAAIGVLADNGVRASRAGTALNAALSRIAGRTGGAEDAMSELGVSISQITDSEGNFRRLDIVIAELAEGFSELEGEAERMRVATELAGRNGARALLPLINSQETLNEKMGDVWASEIQESIGQLNDISPEQVDAVRQALDMSDEMDPTRMSANELVSHFQELEAEGASVEDMAARLQAGLQIGGNAATQFAQQIAEGDASARRLAEGIGGAATATQIAAAQMDTAAGMATFLRSSIDALGFAVFTALSPAIERMNRGLSRAINVLNSNRDVIQALAIPITVVAGALATLIGLVVTASVKGLILGKVLSALNFNAVTASIAGSSGLTGALSTAIGLLTNFISSFVSFAAISLAAKIAAVLGVITATIMALQRAISTNFLGVGDDLAMILNTISSASETLQDVLGPVIDVAVAVTKALFGVAGALLALPIIAIIIGIREILSVLIMLVTGLDELLGITETVVPVLEMVSTQFDKIGEAVGPVIERVEGFISANRAVIRVMSTVLTLWTAVAARSAILAASQSALAITTGGLTTAYGFLTTATTAYAASARGAIGALATMGGLLNLNAARTYALAAAQYASAAASGLFAAVTGGLSTALGLATAAATAFWTALGPIGWAVLAIAAAIGILIAVWKTDFLGIATTTKEILGAAQSEFNDFLDWVTGITDSFDGIGASIIDELIGGLLGGIPRVRSAVARVAEVVRAHLPFSDAEMGPLSNLSDTGKALVDTFISGMLDGEGLLQETLASLLDFAAPAADMYGGMMSQLPGGQGLGEQVSSLGDDDDGDDGDDPPPASIVVEQDITLEGDRSPEEIREAGAAAEEGALEGLAELQRRIDMNLG